jgi:spore coat protein CotH
MTSRFHIPIFIVIITLVFLAPQRRALAQNPGDSIFAGTRVYTIRLEFKQQRFIDSLMYYHDLGTEQYMMANMTIDGTPYDSVGVRFKGNSSYTYPGTKKSMKIDFGEYRSDLKWDGVKGVHLNNGWGDPSFLREKMYLDFCRDAGIHAPRANYARVIVNDTLFGLYTIIETVDKRFLKNHYGNSGGDLFKAVDNFIPGGPNQTILSDFTWYGAMDTNYTARYEMKTDGSTTAWPKLIAFIDSLNNVAPIATVLPGKCDVPALQNAIAADILFGNLDSYIGSGRNFYFYFNTATGKLEWIIWDTGLSFGVYSGGVSRAETMNLLYTSGATDRPLVNKLFGDETLKHEYLVNLCTLFTTAFTTAKLYPHIDSVAAIIRPAVIEDPKKMYTVQQFETNLSTDINADGGGGTRKPGLKSFISSRRTSVQSQLTALGITCATGIDDNPHAAPTSAGLAWCYPNPARGVLTILADVSASPRVAVTLYDALGRAVASQQREQQSPGISAFTFDLSSLPAGTYRYTVASGSGLRTGHAVVAR